MAIRGCSGFGETHRLRTGVYHTRPTLVYNSQKQTWPWAPKGRAGLVRQQHAEQGQWQQCADTGHQLQMMQQQQCPGHSSDRAAPISLASRQEALSMQLSPEENSSQS